MPTRSSKVLISGAGVAGPTLAFFLDRAGFEVTVVERSEKARSSGAPVDVRGVALPVVKEMGVYADLRAARIQRSSLALLDSHGRTRARIDTAAFDLARGDDELELPRAELANILAEPTRDSVEYVMGDTVTSLADDGRGVDVTFERGRPRRFDLVVGADGLHSRVRRLAFGVDTDFVRPLGMYFATIPFEGTLTRAGELVLFNAPNRLASIHPVKGSPMVAFIFRTDAKPGDDPRRFVAEQFARDGWRIPELLETLRRTEHFYFDGVCQVRVPKWSRGRVALLGDAASCVSIFGEGSSMALAGGACLGKALSQANTSPEAAFEAYEREHRPRVERFQRGMGLGSRLVVPKTRLGIEARALAARISPLVTSFERWRHRAQPAAAIKA
jgi:2-polyprenyl-6-methoxyphenol hydroxylase-like FAD-dependent oxidoreductase